MSAFKVGDIVRTRFGLCQRPAGALAKIMPPYTGGIIYRLQFAGAGPLTPNLAIGPHLEHVSALELLAMQVDDAILWA